MGQDRGAAPSCCGMWHRDSPEGHDAGAAGPDEDKGAGGLAFLLLRAITGRPHAGAQHLQLAQGQAELRARGAARSAERSGRE